MDPWGTPALTGYSCKDFPSRTTKEHQLLRKKKAKYLTWNSVRLKFVKKVSMSNSVKSLGCIKYYSLSSPRLVKSTNCIRHNCQKICRWSRRSKTILEIRKNTTFLKEINNPIIYKFFKDATNERRITRRIVCIEVSAPLKNTIPLSCQAPPPPKSANIPSPPLSRQSPHLYIGFSWTPTSSLTGFSVNPKNSSRPFPNILKARHHQWNMVSMGLSSPPIKC